MVVQWMRLRLLRPLNSTKWALVALAITSALLVVHVYIGYEDSVKLSTGYRAVKEKIYIYPTKARPARPDYGQRQKEETSPREANTIDTTVVKHTDFSQNQSSVFALYTPETIQKKVSQNQSSVFASNTPETIQKKVQFSSKDPHTYPTKAQRKRLPSSETFNASLKENLLFVAKTTPATKESLVGQETRQNTLGVSSENSVKPTNVPETIQIKDGDLAVSYNHQSRLNLTEGLAITNVSFPFGETPYRGYWVEADGLLVDRLEKYNAAISILRKQILDKRGYKPWTEVNTSSLQVLWGSVDDFLDKLSEKKEVKTVFLPWSLRDSHALGAWDSMRDFSNVLIQKYYKWVATQPLCLWIETAGLTKARWDAVYNRTCTQDYKEARNPTPLEVVYLNAKPINRNHYWPNDGNAYPESLYTTVPKYVFYIHVVEDAIVTPPGDIISGSLKLVPYTCAHDINGNLPGNVDISPMYKEVFIITQFWGNEFFHRMLEMMPRIIPYLGFLRANKDVLISIPGEDSSLRELFSILGISTERTVIGTVRAKIAYMPRGTSCAFPLVQETQLFALEMRNYISNSLSPRKRKKLIMIRRSGLRQFRYNDLIEKTLHDLADEYKLEFALFRDNPTPPLRETMTIFYEAVMVVAPHGAGLANLLFSQPGTYVIECVCNPPHVNMCFQRTAHILGHRYHGIPSREGCEGEIHVYPEVIDFVARRYLDYMTSQKNS